MCVPSCSEPMPKRCGNELKSSTEPREEGAMVRGEDGLEVEGGWDELSPTAEFAEALEGVCCASCSTG
jgi:hypothetical protein